MMVGSPEAYELVAPDTALAHINAVLSERAPDLTPAEIDAIAETIEHSSQRFGVDPDLVLGIITIESGFRGREQSAHGAIGLMQVKPSTARAFAEHAGVDWRGSKTLLDPTANIRIGVAYLAHLLQRFGGDVALALSAYCHGPTRIMALRRAGKVPAQNLVYSWKVVRVSHAYRLIARAIDAPRGWGRG